MSRLADMGRLFDSLQPGDLLIFSCFDKKCKQTHECAVLQVEGAGTEKRIWVSEDGENMRHLPWVILNPLRWDDVSSKILDRSGDDFVLRPDFSVDRGGAAEYLKRYQAIPSLTHDTDCPTPQVVEDYLKANHALNWLGLSVTMP